MSLKRVGDLPEPKPCLDPEHCIPSFAHLFPGIYEHVCPGCGKKSRFAITETYNLDVEGLDVEGKRTLRNLRGGW